MTPKTVKETPEGGLSIRDLFGIRPKVGDVWTIKRKGRKITKEVGRIYRTRFRRGSGENETQPLLVYVEWARLPKGRYSGIRAKWLMKNGTRISTKAERDAAFEKRMAARGIPNAYSPNSNQYNSPP
jgi:hypothetical protein